MNTSAKPELIGIAGSFASGKDTVAHHLRDVFGYTHVSTNDIVREIALSERGSIERPVLHAVADHYRRHHGAGVFVTMALDKPRPLVVTGIRSLGEAKALKAAGGVLLFIDAPVALRYERMKMRHRDSEVHLSLEEFEASEKGEWYSGDDDADFNLRGIKAMSDCVVENDAPLEAFIGAVYAELGIAQYSDL